MPATELFKTTVSTVLSKLTEKPALVYAHAKQSIEECLQLMALHNITALPITANGASTSSDFQGIVNLFDILYFVAFCAVPDDVSHAQGTAYMDKQAVEQMKQPIASLLDTNDRTRESFRLWSFGQGDTLDKVLETLSKGVHRVLVTGGKTGVMLSQTDLLKYIQNHEPEFKKSAEYDQTLRQLKLFPSRPYGKSGQAVVSVLHSVSALAAYRKMAKEGVTAVPVLNAQGQVVATLSASDLRGLAPLSLKDLLLPVDQFLEVYTCLCSEYSLYFRRGQRLCAVDMPLKLWPIPKRPACAIPLSNCWMPRFTMFGLFNLATSSLASLA